MYRIPLLLVLCVAAPGWLLSPLLAEEPMKKPEPRKTVIPFDFESRFDDGRYGQQVGDLIWKSLQRRGGFVIPEAMLDVRDWCQQSRFHPGLDTPVDKMKTVVRKDQGGDIGIWGKVERVPGTDRDVYDLWIYVADFSGDSVKMIYEKKARTRTVSEIPHTYVKEALDHLYGKPEVVVAAADPGIRERWEKGPTLIQGDFDLGRDAPAGWDPLPRHVSWVPGEGGARGNRMIRFTIPQAVAETTGVLYYSDYFPVEAGATYRFQCRWRGSGTAVKVFVKCYDEVPGSVTGTQRREVYRNQQNLTGEANTWNVQTEDFTPKHSQYTPRWGRVMLYGYYPAGTVEWDDVVVKQVVPPPADKEGKEPKPSLGTKDPPRDDE